jgi:hypothetical protein
MYYSVYLRVLALVKDRSCVAAGSCLLLAGQSLTERWDIHDEKRSDGPSILGIGPGLWIVDRGQRRGLGV